MADAPQDAYVVDETIWARMRKGATAARGFHFQDLVGAWLSAQLLNSKLSADRVVPEHYEDLVCEGGSGWHIQVKSRQGHVGPFRQSYVARLLLEVRDRQESVGSNGPVMLILERQVIGFTPGEFEQPLAALPGGLDVVKAANALAVSGARPELSDDFVSRLSLHILPWNVASTETRDLLSQRFNVPPVVAAHLGLVLRDVIAECQDHNAQSSMNGRRGVVAADAASTLIDALSGMSFEHLDQAFREGICETLDLDTPLLEDKFFEGIESQPGHIAAGLPTPRPRETEAVLSSLQSGSAVVVTGPSGIGKSTIMWAATYASRNVLWLRVNQLTGPDVEALVRFARASMPSARSPIGFVVDGIGRAGIDAWDSLRAQVARVPHVFLVGTCRTEDLVSITSLAECSLVEVELDEPTAERIHHQLSDLGKTTAPHWREPFEAARGLTLEYTYLLTKGARLQEVIADQVRRRVEENRHAELAILRFASTAHRWRSQIDVQSLQDHLGLQNDDLARALRTLKNEHLLFEVDGYLNGRHQLRSTALSTATHEFPPPMLTQTVSELVGLLTALQLRAFVTATLIERPDLDEVVLRALIERNQSAQDIQLLTESLEALRLVDFQRVAVAWNATLVDENVAIAFRAVTVQLAMAGAEDVDYLKPEIVSAIPKLTGATGMSGHLRDSFLASVGSEWLAMVLGNSTSLTDVADMLSALSDTTDTITSNLALEGTHLEELLQQCSVDELADLLSAARVLSVECAVALREHAGGADNVAARVLDADPWIVEAGAIAQDDEIIARGRVLVVSEETITDYHQDAVRVAKLILRCFPEAIRADVKLLWPDRAPAAVGDHELGVSELRRRYAISDREVQWNRLRAAMASSSWRVGGTERAHTANELLADLPNYLALLARRYVLGRLRSNELSTANQLAESLAAKADTLSNFVSAEPATAHMDLTVERSDDAMHTLVNGVTANLTAGLGRDEREPAQMIAFIQDTLLPAAREAKIQERWELVDADPSELLDVVASALSDLVVVLRAVRFGEMTQSEVRQIASNGPYDDALTRVTRAALKRGQSATAQFVASLEQALQITGLDVTVISRHDEEVEPFTWPALKFCIGISCDDFPNLDENLALTSEALASLDWRDSVTPQVLLVPTFVGRPFVEFTHKWTGKLWPAADEFPPWQEEFSPRIEPTLHSTTKSSLEAVRSISAAIDVSKSRTHSDAIQQFVDQQTLMIKDCLSTIAALKTDPVVLEVTNCICELAERVEQEAENDNPVDETVARLVAQGLRGAENDVWNSFLGCSLLAAQWDVDPTSATTILTHIDAKPES